MVCSRTTDVIPDRSVTPRYKLTADVHGWTLEAGRAQIRRKSIITESLQAFSGIRATKERKNTWTIVANSVLICG